MIFRSRLQAGGLDLVIPERKLREYLLNLSHEEGGSKAKFFLSLGFTVPTLRDALFAQAASGSVQIVLNPPFGMKLRVLGAIATPDGRTMNILTVWKIDQEHPGVASLITARPNSRA